MWERFFYKISKDLLVSLVITYFLLLIPELVLPGIVSSHFNPKYVLLAILFLGITFSYLGKKYKTAEKPKFQAISRNLLNIILFFITLMLILSLFKMRFWQIAIVTLITLPLLVGTQKILIGEDQ